MKSKLIFWVPLLRFTRILRLFWILKIPWDFFLRRRSYSRMWIWFFREIDHLSKKKFYFRKQSKFFLEEYRSSVWWMNEGSCLLVLLNKLWFQRIEKEPCLRFLQKKSRMSFLWNALNIESFLAILSLEDIASRENTNDFWVTLSAKKAKNFEISLRFRKA